MANRSPAAKTATNTVPAPVGPTLKALPRDVAGHVSSFLELAPGLANSSANLATLQRILKDGHPGRRDGGGVNKGYCRKVGRVLVRIFWKMAAVCLALHRAEK